MLFQILYKHEKWSGISSWCKSKNVKFELLNAWTNKRWNLRNEGRFPQSFWDSSPVICRLVGGQKNLCTQENQKSHYPPFVAALCNYHDRQAEESSSWRWVTFSIYFCNSKVPLSVGAERDTCHKPPSQITPDGMSAIIGLHTRLRNVCMENKLGGIVFSLQVPPIPNNSSYIAKRVFLHGVG